MANLSDILTNYQSVDTLDSVTDRGATTTNAITIGNLTSTGIDDNASSTAITIDSSERVGIGTGSSIQSNLHVKGPVNTQTSLQLESPTSQYASQLLFDGIVGSSADYLLGIIDASWDTHTNVVSSIRFESGSDTTNKDDGLISFWTSSSGPSLTERMRINTNGNVGIGTTNPTSKLQVEGSVAVAPSSTAGDFLTIASGNYETIIGGWSNGTDSDIDGLLSGSTFGSIMRVAPNGHFVVALQENDNADTFSIVSGGGNYQTDTTYDTLAFTVNALGTTQAAGSVQGGNQFQNGANGGNLIARVPGGAVSQQSAVSFWGTFYNYSADTGPRRVADISAGFSTGTWTTEFMAFGVGNAGSGNDSGNKTDEKMRIHNDGSVRIGTTAAGTSSARLHVKSTGVVISPYRDASTSTLAIMTFRSNHVSTENAVCRIDVDGDLKNYNNSYGSISDQTLKENIIDASSQWEDIKNIRVRSFNFIGDSKTQLGVVAQELETSGMAGLVKDDDEGIKSVKYSVLYMKAVKALQEAIVKIEDLETRLAAVESN